MEARQHASAPINVSQGFDEQSTSDKQSSGKNLLVSILKESSLHEPSLKRKSRRELEGSQTSLRKSVRIAEEIEVIEVENWKSQNVLATDAKPRCTVCAVM